MCGFPDCPYHHGLCQIDGCSRRTGRDHPICFPHRTELPSDLERLIRGAFNRHRDNPSDPLHKGFLDSYVRDSGDYWANGRQSKQVLESARQRELDMPRRGELWRSKHD